MKQARKQRQARRRVARRAVIAAGLMLAAFAVGVMLALGGPGGVSGQVTTPAGTVYQP